jgi:hypothetical protein
MKAPAMQYPTLEEVKGATMGQLKAWWHDLPRPNDDTEREILHQIIETILDMSEQLEAQNKD